MDFLKDLSLDKVRNLAEDAFNQAKPKTEVEARVYEVLSHKNWGSSSTLLNEVSQDTFDYDKFAVISQLMWEAMENQRPAAWRVVFKGLVLLEHLIKNGSERCVDDARNHSSTLKSLQKFNYYEGTVDRGQGVREKTKQIVELLSDDARVREERQKSRRMREKLGDLKAKSGGGGGGAYSGYGNDNWNSGGGDEGGYANGGIGAGGASGRYGGRYDEDRDTRAPTRAAEPAPTFASLPDDTKKPKKIKKKKKSSDTEPAAEVDLFSFGAPEPAAAPAAAADDEFDAFQSAGSTEAVPAVMVPDPFAAPPPAAASFDVFGSTGMVQQQPVMQQQTQFGAFGGPSSVAMPVAMNNNMAFTNNTMLGGGSMMQQQQQRPMGGMQGGMNNSHQFNATTPTTNQAADDDDFGDFEVAAPKTVSKDPLSKLISLDGLTKNPKNKKEEKLNQPIIYNSAAATFVQEKDQIHDRIQQAAKASKTTGFAGIDGLHKQPPSSMGMGFTGMNTMMSPAMTMAPNPSVMGGGGGGSDAISSMMDPRALSAPKPVVSQQQQHGMMNPQMMMGNPQMMGGLQQGMMGNPQMMMGAQQPGMMMGGTNMSMMNPGMPAQANYGGMQGVNMGMTPQQQQQMMMMMNMNQQGMGGNMPNGMGGGMQGGMGMPGMMNQQQQSGNMNQMGGFR